MIASMKNASSLELRRRVASLTEEDRALVMHNLEGMRSAWCEEMQAKFSYWDELPHCLMAMYPKDGRSQDFAKAAVAKWDDLVARGGTRSVHRVASRLLSPDAGLPFAGLVRSLAESGVMRDELEVELLEMSMVSTYEQRIEEVHARVYQLNASVGRNLEVPITCARLRQNETFEKLTDWRATAFVTHIWKKKIVADLLRVCATPQFAKLTSHLDHIRFVYHCLPSQLFKKLNEDRLVQRDFKLALWPALPKVGPGIKALSDYLHDRLPAGAVFSLPRAAVCGEGQAPEAVGAEHAIVVVQRGDGGIVGDALAEAGEDTGGQSIVRISRRCSGLAFFRVVKSDVASRYVQHDTGRRQLLIAVEELYLHNRDGSSGIFVRRPGGEPRMLDLQTIFNAMGCRGLLSSLALWAPEKRSQLRLAVPAAAQASDHMRSARVRADSMLVARAASDPGQDRAEEAIVSSILQLGGTAVRLDCVEGPLSHRKVTLSLETLYRAPDPDRKTKET